MSAPVPNMQPEVFDSKHAGIPYLILAATGVAGIVGCVIGAMMDGRQLAFSWLFAFIYFFTLCAGCLFWILVHHATDAAWSVLVRRVLENVASLIPVCFLGIIPVLIYAPFLFHWWNLAPGEDPLLDAKRGYLNHTFFIVRTLLYFFILSGVALVLKRLSTRQDGDGNTWNSVYMRKIAVAGIPLFALSLTFGAFDWLMGLDYHWFSTMWGVYIFAGAAGSSMSLLVLLVTGLRRKGYLSCVTMEHYHIMGKLMLAFCVFWAYIGFSQYMLIWYADMPEETSYFLRRNVASWNALSIFLVCGRFFIPFPLLLLQGLKKNPKHLCMVAGWIVFMQAVDMYIIVMPMLHQRGFRPHILDLCTLAAIGSVLGLLFLKGLGKYNLIPLRDPRLKESLELTN